MFKRWYFWIAGILAAALASLVAVFARRRAPDPTAEMEQLVDKLLKAEDKRVNEEIATIKKESAADLEEAYRQLKEDVKDDPSTSNLAAAVALISRGGPRGPSDNADK